MNPRLIPLLALALLSAPSALAENPTISVPTVDPAGPGTAAEDVAAAAEALATGAVAGASAVPGVTLAACSAPAVPPVGAPTCAVTVANDEGQVFATLLATFVDDATTAVDPLTSDPAGPVLAIVLVKVQEASAVAGALAGDFVPAYTALAAIVGQAFQDHVCAFGPPGVPDAEDLPSCGSDSALGNTIAGLDAIYGATHGVLVQVDAGPTCASLAPALAMFGVPADCAALPDGGMVAALLPPSLA